MTQFEADRGELAGWKWNFPETRKRLLNGLLDLIAISDPPVPPGSPPVVPDPDEPVPIEEPPRPVPIPTDPPPEPLQGHPEKGARQ
jgi:hypothetical protein